MRSVTTFLSAVGAAGLLACVSAAAPDLNGQWALQPGPDAGAAAGFCYLSCTVTQKPDELDVWARGRMTTYKLDGSPASTTTRNGGTAIEIVTTAKWAGDKLVITRNAKELNGDNRTAAMTLTVSRQGATMVVEYRGTGPGASEPVTARAVYAKSGR
jgi:hypothetical protein